MPPIAPGNPARRVKPDGRRRFHFIDESDDTVVTNLAAVTTAMLAESHDLSRYTPKDGWSGTPTFNKVANTDVTEVFDAEDQGTWSFSPTWQLYIQVQDENHSFELFSPAGLVGVLLEFWGLDLNTAPTEGDAYYAYRMRTSIPVPVPATTNENQRFSLDPAVLQAPEFSGTLVAGS